MTISMIVEILGYFAVAAMVVLAAANVFVIVARVAHHESLAEKMVATTNHFAWIFRFGGSSGRRKGGGASARRWPHPTR